MEVGGGGWVERGGERRGRGGKLYEILKVNFDGEDRVFKAQSSSSIVLAKFSSFFWYLKIEI